MDYTYGIEKHLEIIVSQHSEYKVLLTHWEMVKANVEKYLNSIIKIFPTYSLHDKSHSENVLFNIERVLGKERIETLTPIDCYLTLMGAYTHDIGMVFNEKDVIECIHDEGFQDWINRKAVSDYNDSFKKAVTTLNTYGSLQNGDDKCKNDIDIIFAVTEYMRKNHSERSRNKILEYFMTGVKTITTNIDIPDVFFRYLADIAYTHNRKNNEKMNLLPRKVDGIGREYAHPLFVAFLLSIGDTLDLSDNRFHPFTVDYYGELPCESQLHYKKHKSTRNIKIDCNEIYISVDCPDNKILRLYKKEYNGLKELIDFCKVNSHKINPDNFVGTMSNLLPFDACVNGKKIPDDILHLKFNITHQKAFEIISGSNIYTSEVPFIRELVQNAMDATRFRIWDILQSPNGKMWLKNNVTHINNKLQPYDFTNADLFYSYPIAVEVQPVYVFENEYVSFDTRNEKDVKTIPENAKLMLKVSVVDFGIGIDYKTLEKIGNIGTSYNTDFMRRKIKDMPEWLKPSGNFGIGMQTVFMFTEQLHCISRSPYDGNVLCITFNNKTDSDGGFIESKFYDNETYEKNKAEYKKRINDSVNRECYFYDENIYSINYSTKMFMYISVEKINNIYNSDASTFESAKFNPNAEGIKRDLVVLNQFIWSIEQEIQINNGYGFFRVETPLCKKKNDEKPSDSSMTIEGGLSNESIFKFSYEPRNKIVYDLKAVWICCLMDGCFYKAIESEEVLNEITSDKTEVSEDKPYIVTPRDGLYIWINEDSHLQDKNPLNAIVRIGFDELSWFDKYEQSKIYFSYRGIKLDDAVLSLTDYLVRIDLYSYEAKDILHLNRQQFKNELIQKQIVERIHKASMDKLLKLLNSTDLMNEIYAYALRNYEPNAYYFGSLDAFDNLAVFVSAISQYVVEKKYRNENLSRLKTLYIAGYPSEIHADILNMLCDGSTIYDVRGLSINGLCNHDNLHIFRNWYLYSIKNTDTEELVDISLSFIAKDGVEIDYKNRNLMKAFFNSIIIDNKDDVFKYRQDDPFIVCELIKGLESFKVSDTPYFAKEIRFTKNVIEGAVVSNKMLLPITFSVLKSFMNDKELIKGLRKNKIFIFINYVKESPHQIFTESEETIKQKCEELYQHLFGVLGEVNP